MVRQLMRMLAVAGALALAVACDTRDTRLETLTVGISKDSSLVLMEAAPRRSDQYLANSQNIEALYFTAKGASSTDTASDRAMLPVVLIDGALAGWGWDYWDSLAAANSIEVAPKLP